MWSLRSKRFNKLRRKYINTFLTCTGLESKVLDDTQVNNCGYHDFRVHLDDNDVIKQRSFSFAFFMYRQQCCQNDPCFAVKTTWNTMYYACLASSKRCLFVKKKGKKRKKKKRMQTHNTYAQDITIFHKCMFL